MATTRLDLFVGSGSGQVRIYHKRRAARTLRRSPPDRCSRREGKEFAIPEPLKASASVRSSRTSDGDRRLDLVLGSSDGRPYFALGVREQPPAAGDGAHTAAAAS
jgi:hypothetical protein